MNKMIAALLFTFSVSASAEFVIWAPHPASVFLQNAVTKVEAVVADKGDAASKVQPLCQIIKDTASMGYIGGVWLGNYKNLATDQAGVKAFVAMMPSYAMTQLMPNLTGANGAVVTVSPLATQRNPSTWAVGVKIVTGGKTYSGQAIIHEINGSLRLIDGEYFGVSGVGYMKGDFQKKLDAAAKKNPRTPVMDVVKELSSESGFVNCP